MRRTISLPAELLHRLRRVVQYSQDEWAELIEAKPARKDAQVELSESAFLRLADAFELDPQNLLAGRVDFSVLAARARGAVLAIPEEFSVGASSRIRTSAHLFDCVESRFGWRAREQLLRQFQLNESVIAEPDTRINIRFLTRLCEEMRALGIDDDDFFEMGMRSVVKNYRSPAGDAFRETRSARELYERCFTEVIQSHYDQNFTYRVVSLDDERCIVEAKCNHDVCDQLKERRLGSALTCANKAGGFASLTGYKHLPFARVEETRCVHRGDPACVFEIYYSHVRAASA